MSSAEHSDAHRSGIAAGEEHDRRLRAVERRERIANLQAAGILGSLTIESRSDRMEATARELREVRELQRAIKESLGWRLIQMARRLLGREWPI